MRKILLICAMLAAMIFAASVVRAEDSLGADKSQIPAAYRNVGVDEHLNLELPLDSRLYDENGQYTSLRSVLHPNRPILLQLGYLGCPMLCDTLSHSLVDSAKRLDLTIGKDFDFVFVSIDPTDTPALATLKRNSYAQEYGRPGSETGFHFLVAKPKEIDEITTAAGYRYQAAPNGQFAHPAVVLVVTPEGKISRYLYGLSFPEQTLHLSLVEASQEKIGTTMDQILLICLHWDPSTGKYSLAAMNLMRLGGIVTMAVLGGAIFWMVKRGPHPQAIENEQPKDPNDTNG
jgi:protein SCO1/2